MNLKNLTVKEAGRLGRKIGKQISEKIKKCSPILDERYKECDSRGHLKPAEKENICYHCYRQLKYDTPRTGAKYAYRKDLHPLDVPMDAAAIHEEMLEEIGSQQAEDKMNGLAAIAKELNLK